MKLTTNEKRAYSALALFICSYVFLSVADYAYPALIWSIIVVALLFPIALIAVIVKASSKK